MSILGPVLGREVAGGGRNRPEKMVTRKRGAGSSGREKEAAGFGVSENGNPKSPNP